MAGNEIVEWLREEARTAKDPLSAVARPSCAEVCLEAAAEIERLQAEVERLREAGDELARTVKDAKAGLHQALTKRELSFVADALTQWHRAALAAKERTASSPHTPR